MVKKKRQAEPGDDCGESTESCEENVTQSCSHINKSVNVTALRKILKTCGLRVDCAECEKSPATVIALPAASEENWDPQESVAGCSPDPHLWMCLQCGTQLCSRNKNKHAELHFTKPHSDRHQLVINTTTWEVFCYACPRLVSSTASKKLQEAVELLKKQSNSVGIRERDVNLDDKITEATTCILKTDFSPSNFLNNYSNSYNSSPGVIGLYNFGNTCFFNSVMQCLVQTPYLTTVLRKGEVAGNPMKIDGGKIKLDDDTETELPPIRGELNSWGPLTQELTCTLEKLAAPGSGGAYRPQPLFNNLVAQFPQFGDGEQHDSHELLRQLLEGVRNEDLRLYQKVVLQKMDLDSRQKRTTVDEEKKKIIKFYGQKIAEKLLGPDQVFRGYLVSTLECQECQHTSDRKETFLDLSLPVTAEKPQPPAVTRRKAIPEEQFNSAGTSGENKMSKNQAKKERRHNSPSRGSGSRKQKNNKKGGGGGGASPIDKQTDNKQANDVNENKSESKSSSEQSDADVEDNLEEYPMLKTDNNKVNNDSVRPQADTAANFALYHMESGYNSEKLISSDSIRASPDLENKEKSDTSPKRLDKEEPFCLSAMAIPLEYKPLSGIESPHLDSGVASPDAGKSDTPQATSKELGSPSSLSSEINMDMSSPRQDVSPDNDILRPVSRISFVNSENHSVTNAEENPSTSYGCPEPADISVTITNGCPEPATSTGDKADAASTAMDEDSLIKRPANKFPPNLSLSVNDNFYLPMDNSDFTSSKWKKNSSFFPSSTVSPRYQCDEGEYSVQSCLNQFTSSELLAGNNKVSCEACTKRANSEKTIYTNATKRFLISSPPAVLILHLKRFQIGPRCMFRKITKHVNFPLILDLAPFCSDKIKSLPIVSPDQTKLLYSLYGVVEHSGSMHGGHYVAYVKVRPKVDSHDKRWSFLPTDIDSDEEMDENSKKSPVNGVNGNGSDSSMSGYESGEKASGYTPETPPGKWYYISDSRVQEISQEKVLNTQAYLLFYERIL